MGERLSASAARTGSDEEDHRDGGADHNHSHAQHGLREPSPEPPPDLAPHSRPHRKDPRRLPGDMPAHRKYHAGYEAVSYTHLDVYKRQGLDICALRPLLARC